MVREDLIVGAADDAAVDRHRPATAVSVVEESDSYARSLRGIEAQAIRTGKGSGPTSIASVAGDEYVATSVTTGFPMLASTTVGDGLLVVAAIRSAPPGTRWCENDIAPGMIVVYGPGAEHTAVNAEGLSFAFMVAKIDDITRIAHEMHIEPSPPPFGEVHMLAPSPAARQLGGTLAPLVQRTRYDHPSQVGSTDLLASVAAALERPRLDARAGAGRSIDNRRVALACLAHAEAIGRMPTILELRRVAHVSERRLREAFVRTFGQPPGRFFRMWALEAARERFQQPQTFRADAVSTTAYDLGFRHTGRFSAYYKRQFGEYPSDTQKRSAPTLASARSS